MALAGVFIWQWSQTPDQLNFPKKEKVWQTVPAKIAKDFSSLKIPGKVKSNQFAMIAPRRNGIIQDLLVDIGDKITQVYPNKCPSSCCFLSYCENQKHHSLIPAILYTVRPPSIVKFYHYNKVQNIFRNFRL